jgi:hypothetical protein
MAYLGFNILRITQRNVMVRAVMVRAIHELPLGFLF